MARFFPGERISQIHGMARVIDGRMCVAMYHPAAGLHQASLADIIRSDFRKLPLFIEQARKMLAPVVQPEDDGQEAVDNTEVQALVTEAPLQTSDTAEVEEAVQAQAKPPEAAQKKRGKREKSENDYKQLNFFDL